MLLIVHSLENTDLRCEEGLEPSYWGPGPGCDWKAALYLQRLEYSYAWLYSKVPLLWKVHERLETCL